MRTVWVGMLGLVVVLLSGCVSGESVLTRGYGGRLANAEKIAVVAVVGRMHQAQKNEVADFVTMELARRGYVPVERLQVAQILKAQKFEHSGHTPEASAVRIGRMLNVPVVVLVNVPKWGGKTRMNVKLIEVESSVVMLLGEASGSTGSVLSTVAGAVVGGAAGYGLGGSSSGRRFGTVTGAVIGGVVGHSLSGSQRKTVKKMIGVMLESLPAR